MTRGGGDWLVVLLFLAMMGGLVAAGYLLPASIRHGPAWPFVLFALVLLSFVPFLAAEPLARSLRRARAKCGKMWAKRTK